MIRKTPQGPQILRRWIKLTLYQALAAPTLSFCPRASSRRSKGMPTTNSITRKGMMNAPEKR